MLVVGLTGGIGSGKTSVSNLFTKLGIPVVDADVISRTLTQNGSEAVYAIEASFGPSVMRGPAELDREKLRDKVFQHPELLKKLEKILHPRIRAEISKQIKTLTAARHPYCIVAVPLIIEANMLDLVDMLIVVDVPVELQIARVTGRDKVSIEQVKKILRQQTQRGTRLSYADFVIDNGGNLEHLANAVSSLDIRLRKQAESQPSTSKP